jgi:hypothetical protein
MTTSGRNVHHLTDIIRPVPRGDDAAAISKPLDRITIEKKCGNVNMISEDIIL